MFKKPKKNLSLKSTRHVDDDENDQGQVETKTEPPIESVTSSLPVTKAAVSFSEEIEEVEEFRVKKSERSVRVARQLKEDYQRSLKIPGHVEMQDHTEVILIGEEAEATDETITNSSQPATVSESLNNMLKSGVLPDANMIHIIRKKRQLMRDSGIATGEPVIGNVGAPLKVLPKREDKSALVREDDDADRSDLSDQEESNERLLKMSIRERQEDKRMQLRHEFLAAEQGSDVESEHEKEWEKMQISKGVSTLTVTDRQTMQIADEAQKATRKINRHQVLTKTSVDEVKSDLSKHLANLKDSHRRHKFEKQARLDSFEFSLEEIKKAQDSANNLDHRYCFYQELLAYVTDFIDCYNTKCAAIEKLESDIFSVFRQRAERLMKRRRQDVVDQSIETAPLKPGHNVFQPDEEMKVRITDRNNRRSRRIWKRQSQGVKDHYDGWSTDDEEATSDNVRLGNERDSVRKQVSETLSEICDDFVMLDSVTSRFDCWRQEDPESYRAAFGGLCLSKLVSPIIRLHVLDWNPLEENASSIEEQMWFKSLAQFCKLSVNSNAEFDDLSILPNIVDKVIIPKLNGVVNNIWDPLSHGQTIRLVTLLETLAKIFPSLNIDSKNVRDLVTSVKLKFCNSLDHDVFIPLCSKQALVARQSPLAKFFYRQVWSAVKLFISMSRFSNIISDNALQELMLGSLLNRYLALALTQLDCVTHEVIELYTMILSSIPQIWFAKLAPSQTKTIDKMKPFSLLLFQLLGQFSAMVSDEASKEAVLAFASTISEFFTLIHAYDLAGRIVTDLNIQLAK